MLTVVRPRVLPTPWRATLALLLTMPVGWSAMAWAGEIQLLPLTLREAFEGYAGAEDGIEKSPFYLKQAELAREARVDLSAMLDRHAVASYAYRDRTGYEGDT